MEKYDPKRMELSTRDVVARSIYTEVKEGRGTEHGGAYLDISQKPAEYVKKKLPSMYHQFKELADVDITKGPMEVGPTCHYVMGGIRVDAETAESTVPGLFAAGEAAAGLHGANRLGGNSLSDLLVFGRRAGLAAAQHAKRVSVPSIDNLQIESAEKELLAPFSNSGTESPYAVHRDLQEAMQNLVGIFRTQEDLRKALVGLEKLKTRAAKAGVEGSRLFNPGWHLAYDLKSMLIVSEAVTYSALARAESRGAHSRIDCPKLDTVWEKKHNIIVKEAGAMKRRESPVEEMPGELRQILAADYRLCYTEALAPACEGREQATEITHGRSNLARFSRRFERRPNRGLPRPHRSRHGRSRRAPPHSRPPRAGPRGSLELQSREVRLLLRRSQRASAPGL
jgi:succinate dehydrogenase / fumarate reductase flavoprotein subunit